MGGKTRGLLGRPRGRDRRDARAHLQREGLPGHRPNPASRASAHSPTPVHAGARGKKATARQPSAARGPPATRGISASPGRTARRPSWTGRRPFRAGWRSFRAGWRSFRAGWCSSRTPVRKASGSPTRVSVGSPCRTAALHHGHLGAIPAPERDGDRGMDIPPGRRTGGEIRVRGSTCPYVEELILNRRV